MPEILVRLAQMRREISIVLIVDSLDYLRRGGRIGTASAVMGTLLKIKPILAVVEGRMIPIDQVRTQKRAAERLVAELVSKLSEPDQPVQAGVMHAAAEEELEKLASTIQARFNVTRLFKAELGPVLGAHLGPGALGAGICPEPR
jgi:DegV family protein with EDD domain